jgi:hypothetical protein
VTPRDWLELAAIVFSAGVTLGAAGVHWKVVKKEIRRLEKRIEALENRPANITRSEYEHRHSEILQQIGNLVSGLISVSKPRR